MEPNFLLAALVLTTFALTFWNGQADGQQNYAAYSFTWNAVKPRMAGY